MLTMKIENAEGMLSLLFLIDPEFVAIARGRMPLAKIMDMVALDCWLKEKPEDDFIRELRRQINHAANHGSFDFD